LNQASFLEEKEISVKTNVKAFIGMSKNAGKTTAMNAYIKKNNPHNIALTSIGLDGENLDQITFLPKPKIMIKPGMVCATAKDCLNGANFTYKIIKNLNIFSAMGDIVIVEILSEGNILLAGPTTKKELTKVIETLKTYKPIVYIDGALNRKTFAANHLIDTIILSIGASYHTQMQTTIDDALVLINQLSLKASNTFLKEPPVAFILQTENKTIISKEKDKHVIKSALKKHRPKMMYIKGAVTKYLIDTFIEERVDTFTLIVDDATKLLIHQKAFDYLNKLNIKIEVIHPLTIECITVNPHSVYSMHYDNEAFKQALKQITKVKVVNVLETE